MTRESSPNLKASGTSNSIQTPSILIADSDEAIRFAVSKVLVRAGFRVNTVRDGQQAWEALLRQPCDLLITENEMPRLWGLELIERMRDEGMTTPVVIASGSFPVQRMAEYPQLRIAAVLPKPFGIPEIQDTVRTVLRRSIAKTEVEPSTGEPPHERNRILIVEDDALVRGSLAAVLECEGFAVDEAENGLEAISHAIHNFPALILLDLNMPVMDGWAAFSKLEQVRPLAPVVVMTARPNQYEAAVRAGLDAFMEKPLNIAALVHAIKRLSNENEDSYMRRISDPNFVTELLGQATLFEP